MDIQPLAENQYELGKVKNTAIAAPAISPEQNPELEDSTEPVKLRSKLRLYAVMAGLNVSLIVVPAIFIKIPYGLTKFPSWRSSLQLWTKPLLLQLLQQ